MNPFVGLKANTLDIPVDKKAVPLIKLRHYNYLNYFFINDQLVKI